MLLFVFPLASVKGHGNMVHPPVWMDRDHGNNIGCGVLDLPYTEHEEMTGHKPDCLTQWYSNHMEIPGEPTIPEEMNLPEVKCGGHDTSSHPWSAPGTAPIFGPCGTLGGHPLGCNGTTWSGEQFGDCCGHREGKCGGFALGKNAEEYEWPGEFPVTEWFAGSSQEVAWHVGPNHAGGYSYRLCKVPKGGIKDLTEECFQETPLEFDGEDQWIAYGNPFSNWDADHRIKVTARRTTDGTFPPGSMWTLDPILPKDEEGGSVDTGHGHIIDQVKVPMDLEPGDYVLSFRWDCKCTTQVWTICSNVLII